MLEENPADAVTTQKVAIRYETRSTAPQNSIRNMAARQTKCYFLSNVLVILLIVQEFFLSWNPQDSLSAQKHQHRVLWMQSLSSLPISFIYILILSCHLPLNHSSVIFQSGFKTKILYTFSVSPLSARCPTHFIILNSNFKISDYISMNLLIT